MRVEMTSRSPGLESLEQRVENAHRAICAIDRDLYVKTLGDRDEISLTIRLGAS